MKFAQHFPNTEMADNIMTYFFTFADNPNSYGNGDLKTIDNMQTEYFDRIKRGKHFTSFLNFESAENTK